MDTEINNKQSLKIDILNNNMNYWFLRTNGGNWYDEFYYEEQISINQPRLDIDSIDKLSSKEELIKALTEVNDQKRKNILDKNKKLQEESRLSNKELEEKIAEECLTKRSISMEASRLYNFMFAMKINDYVMIPSKSSNEFRIGIVASNVKRHNVETLSKIRNRSLNDKGKRKYYVSNNTIYREVIWLKAIKKKDIDAVILSVLHMHQTIFSLDEFKTKLNMLISPMYIQDNKLHMNIRVNREEGIDNDLWLEFHKTIQDIEKETEYKANEIKVDVQSPGFIEVIALIDPQTIETIKNHALPTFKPIGWIGFGILIANIFKGYTISKFATIEFTEKDSKKLKEARERTQLVEEDIKYQKAIIESKELQRKIDSIDDNELNTKLRTNIEGNSVNSELEE